MSGEPTLSQHHANDADWTAHLQRLLEQQGYDAGTADGIFGPRTAAAVRQYQFDHDLASDGFFGPQTWGSLNGEADPSEHTNEGQPSGEWSSDPNTEADESGSGWLGQDSDPYLPLLAECGITRFDVAIEFWVRNTGPRDWTPGKVAYNLAVRRDDGTLVQQQNRDLEGTYPGSPHNDEVAFLGLHVPGQYTAELFVIEISNNSVLWSADMVQDVS